MIKESDEWSNPLNHYVLPNTHNYFSVTPLLTETSENTRSMSPQKRRCLFEVTKIILRLSLSETSLLPIRHLCFF